jgi:Polysaccharide lyase
LILSNLAKKAKWLLIRVSLLSAATVIVLFLRRQSGIEPLDDSQVELKKTLDGTTYVVASDGRLFSVDDRNRKWYYMDKVYYPEEMSKAYQHDGGVTYRISEGSEKKIAIRREFSESFEGLSLRVDGLRELVGENRGWGALTLQSPKAREVSDYVKLRNRILQDGQTFLDASIAPDEKHVHSGNRALLCVAPAKPSGMATCKASISSPLVYFANGDDFWYQAYYFAEESLPFTLMDLECEWIKQHAGIRLCITEKGHLEAELKSLDKPRFRQPSDSAVVFPLVKWVKVKTHIHLSNDNEGHVKIWQDDKLIVDASGVTLPLRSAIYSSLEIGISAHSYGSKQAKLWVDDILVSDKPF